MKISKLEIHNIASIENAVIDFDANPLADRRMFLISGKTGTGKTTIINAICLALYDDTAALSAFGSKERNADDISTRDCLQLVRRGAADAHVRLSFTGNDGKRYSASWFAKRINKRKGVKKLEYKKTRILYCIDTDIAVDKFREIDSLIEETVVGLSFDEFLRTTILAQGQFTKFLLAVGDEKSQILEKLTKTKRFSTYGAEIYRRYAAKKSECEALQRLIDSHNLLSDAEKQQISDQLTNLDAEITRIQKDIDHIDRCSAWLADEIKAKTEIAQNEKRLTQARAEIESDTTKADIRLVKLWDDTAEVRTNIADENLHAYKLRQARENIDRIALRYQPLVAGLIALREALTTENNKLAVLSAQETTQSALVPIYSRSAEITTLSALIADLKARSNKYAAAASKAINRYTRTFGTYKPSTSSVNLAKLAADHRSASDRTNNLRKAIDAANTLKTAAEDHSSTLRLIDATKNQIDTSTNELRALEQRIPELRQSFERWHRLALAYADLNSHISDLRQRFDISAGAKCPLCGTEHVNLNTDAQIDNEFRAIKAEEEKASKALEVANSRISELSTILSTLSRALKTQLADESHKSLALADATKAADEAYNIAECSQTDTDNLPNLLSAALAKLNESTSRLEEAQLLIEIRNAESESSAARTQALEKLGILNSILNGHCTADLESFEKISADLITRAKDYYSLLEEIKSHTAEAKQIEHSIADAEEALAIHASALPSTPTLQGIITPNLSTKIALFNADFASATALESSIRQNLELIKSNTYNWLSSHLDISRENLDYLITLKKEQIDQKRAHINALKDSINQALGATQILALQLAKITENRPEMPAETTHASLQNSRNQLIESLNENNNTKHTLLARLQADAITASQSASEQTQLKVLKSQLADLESLNKLFGTSDGKLFRTISQTYVLRTLLYKANQYLRDLDSRYELTCDISSLAINVIDHNQNDEIRNVTGLSGGESFVASLALALALSNLSAKNINVDTLFIDEGFGTLDRDLYESVIETLNRLQQTSGRRVAIISHIEGLKERIPTRIHISRRGKSASTVEIIS